MFSIKVTDRWMCITFLIIGIILDALALVFGSLLDTWFFAILIPGTFYVINALAVLILNRESDKNEYIILDT